MGPDFWSCIENYTYPIEEVTPDLHLSWFRVFEPHSGIFFTQNFSGNLTPDLENTFKLNILGANWGIFFNNETFAHEVWLHDPKNFMLSSNPKTFPKIKLIDQLNNNPTTVMLYLEVFKITKMNKPENPCEEDENYSMTQCIKSFINKEGRKQKRERILL